MKSFNMVSIFLFVVTVVLLNKTLTLFAASTGLPFTVEPMLPENQDEHISSYISVSPQEHSLTQDFQFKIKNESDEKQEIKITIVDAYTSPNGVIQYVNDSSENSEIVNEQYKISRYLISEHDTVTLHQGEAKTVSIQLDVEQMEGVLLGGVNFSAVEKGEEVKEADSTFQINNQINMVIGVMASFATDKETTFIIGEPSIDPMPSYFAIRLPITMDAPVLQQNVLIKYEVLHKDQQLFANEKNFNFAPYTKTNASIPFEYAEIVANEAYTLKGKLIYQDDHDNEKIQQFEEVFMYKKDNEMSAVITSLTAPIEKGSFPIWTFLLFIVPIGLVYYVVRKKKKNHEVTENPSVK